MRKKRDIIIKVIEVNSISNRRLAEFFAGKYMKNKEDMQKQKA